MKNLNKATYEIKNSEDPKPVPLTWKDKVKFRIITFIRLMRKMYFPISDQIGKCNYGDTIRTTMIFTLDFNEDENTTENRERN